MAICYFLNEFELHLLSVIIFFQIKDNGAFFSLVPNVLSVSIWMVSGVEWKEIPFEMQQFTGSDDCYM